MHASSNFANSSRSSAAQPVTPRKSRIRFRKFQMACPYPTIRSLPLLGAKYADYYRRAKIQETVFELLTEQYELAKVQEVRKLHCQSAGSGASSGEEIVSSSDADHVSRNVFVFSISVVGLLAPVIGRPIRMTRANSRAGSCGHAEGADALVLAEWHGTKRGRTKGFGPARRSPAANTGASGSVELDAK